MIAKIYVAYDFYDKDKEKIKKLFCDNLKIYNYDIIPNEVEYLHSTIAFVGEAEIENAIKIKEMLKKIDISDINLKINGKFIVLGSDNKRYLAIEIKNNDELIDIYKKVVDMLNTVKLKTQNTEYLPHISLGKFATNVNSSDKIMSTDISMEIKPQAIKVFKSVDYSKEI